MEGGYTDDDKWVQGGTNPDAYAIWHWHLMDVFVYFSHDVVTLPPPGWVNAAHTHGVKVLGTFLTEWDEGRAICNTLLSSEESSHMYAERLAELAVALGFDGWLINMEVKLEVGQIAHLKEFVKHLTETMHSMVAGSLVIWYDSVTTDGKLDWQDKLNEKNMPFFDLCDGIFVNYTWKENYPKYSAAVAGDRRFDVYMGIDVFGRNTYGGGQWKTHVALDLLKKDNVSAAVFAPGWVYETKQEPDFQTAQNRWWSLVQQSWGILQSYPKLLPFYSNFDQGHGFQVSINGLQIAHDPWNNISCQGFQPIINSSMDASRSTMRVFVDLKDASYSGGGTITCKGKLRDNDSFSTRIFQGQLPVEDRPLHITYSVKSDGNSLMGLSLVFSSKIYGSTSIILADNILASPSMYQSANKQSANKHGKIMSPQVKTTKGAWVIYEASIAMPGSTLGDIGVFCCTKNTGHSVPVIEDLPISENGTSDNPPSSDYHSSLGHISIQASEPDTKFPPDNLWVVESDYILWSLNSRGVKTVSLKITWRLKEGSSLSPTRYNIFVEKVRQIGASVAVDKEYLGVACVSAFYISDLEVPRGVTALRFIVQVQRCDGACQDLDKSPTLLLAVEGQ